MASSNGEGIGAGIAVAALCIAIAIVIAVGVWQLSVNYRTRQELRADAYQACVESGRDECNSVFYPD